MKYAIDDLKKKNTLRFKFEECSCVRKREINYFVFHTFVNKSTEKFMENQKTDCCRLSNKATSLKFDEQKRLPSIVSFQFRNIRKFFP